MTDSAYADKRRITELRRAAGVAREAATAAYRAEHLRAEDVLREGARLLDERANQMERGDGPS